MMLGCCFACRKSQVSSGTNRDMQFWSKSLWFASKNLRWGLGPIETSDSCNKVAVLHAQNHRWRLEPIYSFYSFVNHAVMFAQNHRWGLGPIEICYSVQKVAVLHPKTTREGWDPWRLVILMLITLFCMQKPLKRAGTHRDKWFWCQSRCIACTKRQVMSGTHRDLLFWSKSRCFACKTTDEGWDS